MNWISKLFKTNKTEKSIKYSKEYFEGHDTFKLGLQLSKDAVLDKSLSTESRQQKTNAALEFFDQAILMGYDEAKVFSMRAMVLGRLNYDIDALNDYNICIDKNSEKASYYYNRALIKGGIFDYEGSLADFKEAIRLSKLDNDDTRYWNNYAIETGYESATQKYERDMQILLINISINGKMVKTLHEEKIKLIQRRK